MEKAIPTFPAPIVMGVFLALLLPTWIVTSRFKDNSTRFVIAAIWLRYMMSAFHQYTYPPIAGGLSLNALGSVIVAAIGFLIIDKRLLKLKAFGGIYLVITVLVVSAIINGRTEVIATLTKWGYLIALTIAAYEALQRHGSAALFRALLMVFLPPLALQALSVLTGLGKGSVENGSIVFIGGYNHEAAFSVIMLTFLYCSCFLEPDRPRLTIACAFAALLALLLANYRTSVLAAAPILAATMFFGTIRRISPPGRLIVVIAAITLAGATLLYLSGSALQQRFNDLPVVLSSSANLIKPPEYYTEAEADLLSARAIIWSRYITAYLHGSIANLAFGFGPEAWEDVFTLYAHNTFVSALYETGFFGLVAIMFLFALSFRLAMRTTSSRRPLIMGAHVGFLTLNLATMPLWIIEGNVLFALTLAYTLHVQVPRLSRMP
jgi:O-antigen ligase